jgi:radical SAM-linked protein
MDGARGRVVPAAPLPLGIAGEREVVDVYLAERLPAAAMRQAVVPALPAGWRLVDLHDVWVGAPAPPAAVVAADYRVEVAAPPRAALEVAAGELLAAASLIRERRREKRTTVYDLRPLLLRLEVRGGVASSTVVSLRLRHDQDAVGRPEEVLAALAEPPAPPLSTPLAVVAIVRERLVMLDDLDAPPAR